jgi:hypothetical protein
MFEQAFVAMPDLQQQHDTNADRWCGPIRCVKACECHAQTQQTIGKGMVRLQHLPAGL